MISDGGVYRRVVTTRGLENYEAYMRSGLHRRLVLAKLILDHTDDPAPAGEKTWVRLLTPEQITFISYPFEWCFDELRDAALLTLDVQEHALAQGMSLKDASPFNIQFRGPRPVFIDTLSFEKNTPGPWIAYEQFCRQFLAPLLLMSFGWPDANRYLSVDLNGIPLDSASHLLPWRSRARLGAMLHVYLHARSLRRARGGHSEPTPSARDNKGPLLESLRKTIARLPRPRETSGWCEYYHDSPYYSALASESKELEVRQIAAGVGPALVYDLGANTGRFSRTLAAQGAECIAFERDTRCVNRLYLDERNNPGSRILPLVIDLENPSASLGFGLNNTLSLAERPQADLVLCLALIHHLRFSANLPLAKIARFLARLGRNLLIEFVPAEDPAAAVLLHARDGFDDYTEPAFLESFNPHFLLLRHTPIEDSSRRLYLFERRG